jgi:hypothetical protein
MVTQAIIDHYRCPQSLGVFQLVAKLSEDPGYFSFGSGTLCWGHSTAGSRSKQVTGPLYDVLGDVRVDSGLIRLPLDPNEIVENLRYERYQQASAEHRPLFSNHPMIRDVYYRLRPVLPLAVRKRLQRAHLRHWRKIPFPGWPVDRTVERILETLLMLAMKAQGLDRVPFIWFWPEGAPSCVIMTHDVEDLAGRNFCSKLMDLDDAAGVKASFQIVPQDRYPIPDTFLAEIRHRGFEINVHDLNHDGRLFQRHHVFLRWVERINEYGKKFGALGFRSGALYRNQAWYNALDFSYDMSVPSVAHLDPQRGGCCSVMPFFIGRILELPVTTIQDYSLFHILHDYSIDLWKRQLDVITDQYGLASFIVHPDYIIEQRARRTYETLLEHLARLRQARRIWIALPREVDRWWRTRSQLNLTHNGQKWRIEGPDKERARLAFATLAGDKLTFTVEDSN